MLSDLSKGDEIGFESKSLTPSPFTQFSLHPQHSALFPVHVRQSISKLFWEQLIQIIHLTTDRVHECHFGKKKLKKGRR